MSTTTTADRKRFFGRLFNYANNGLTIAGTVLTTLSGILIVIFLIAPGMNNEIAGAE